MTAGLKVVGLSHHYGAKRALDAISFSVEPGSFCALLGPNGAGKSTLFNLLTGLFSAKTGTIDIAGHDFASNPRGALRRLGVVFQQSTLDLDLTVQHNLSYFAALHGLKGRDAETRIAAVLERLDMRERRKEKVRLLNGGHRRRLELARSLLHEPSVLLLDEPTVGLDAASRAAITSHVHDLCRNDGLTVLWATHLTDEVADGDQLVLLHHGRILADGPAAKLRGTRSLTDYFLSKTGEAVV